MFALPSFGRSLTPVPITVAPPAIFENKQGQEDRLPTQVAGTYDGFGGRWQGRPPLDGNLSHISSTPLQGRWTNE